MSYLITPLARGDLRAIARYTARSWGTEQSRRYRSKLIGCMEKLASGTAHARTASFDPEIMRSRCASHVIWFRQSGGDVEIVAVLHPSMDARSQLGSRGETRQ